MTDYEARAAALAERAREDRRSFDPPSDPPDEQRALSYLTDGVGPSVALYIEARTGGEPVQLSPSTFASLESAMNDWLELYTACYGVETEPSFTVREAAEILVDTRDISDVAQLLTHVPAREGVN